MFDPTSPIRRRLGAAIEWRVRDAVAAAQPADGLASNGDIEKVAAEVKVLRTSITQISAALSDELRSLTDLAEQLDRRVAALERRQP